jgi:hypothetical protein
MGASEEYEGLEAQLAKLYGGYIGEIIYRANGSWISESLVFDTVCYVIGRVADDIRTGPMLDPAALKQRVHRFAELVSVRLWQQQRRWECGKSR